MSIKAIKLILIIAISLTATKQLDAQTESPPSREYLMKAAYLYNFAKFVDWPAGVFLNKNAPITLCILGKDPFGSALKTITGKNVGKRKLVIQHLTRLESLKQCHILFISTSEEKRLPQILSSINGKPILTISEIKGFTQCGGIINFITIENIRFEINEDAAHQAGLRISSELLKLAKSVNKKK